MTSRVLATQSPAARTQLVAAATSCFPELGAKTASSRSPSMELNMSLVACTRLASRTYMASRDSSRAFDLLESRSHTSSTMIRSCRHATTDCWVICASSSEDLDWRCNPMKDPMNPKNESCAAFSRSEARFSLRAPGDAPVYDRR